MGEEAGSQVQLGVVGRFFSPEELIQNPKMYFNSFKFNMF
jgi:hypothetical protein